MSSPNTTDNTPGNAPERDLGSSSRASERLSGEEIAEIEARAAAATPGPWGTLWDGQQFQVVSPHDTAPGECIAEWTYAVRTWEPEATADRAECMTGDGVFIAAARTDVPRLVAALRAAYARLRSYESAICFEVTCTGCAKQLDALATAGAERDQAKAAERKRAADIVTARAERFAEREGPGPVSTALALAASAILHHDEEELTVASDETAEAILVAHQRQRGGCLCGWAELGKSHPGHQVAMLRKAGLIAELLDPAFVRQAEYVADFLVRQVNEEVRHG